MNGRGGVVTFFLFLFLSVIVLLQILLMVESDPYQIWHSSQVEGRGSNRIGFVLFEPEGGYILINLCGK